MDVIAPLIANHVNSLTYSDRKDLSLVRAVSESWARASILHEFFGGRTTSFCTTNGQILT